MSTIIRYLRSEGLWATIKKIGKKLIRRESVTVFLSCSNFPVEVCRPENVQFVRLSMDNLCDFNKVKFFGHIRGEEFIDKPNQGIVLAYIEGVCAGYAAAEFEVDRQIHGLGNFQLELGEAWIGPTYVRRKYRGKGLSSELILLLLHEMGVRGMRICYTAINSENIGSLKSFANADFSQVGKICLSSKNMTCVDEHGVLRRVSILKNK